MTAEAPVVRAPEKQAPGYVTPDAAERARLAAALDEVTRSQGSFDAEHALRVSAEVERAAEALGDAELQMRARLLRAQGLERRGEVGSGGRIGLEVNRWAAEQGHRPLLARSHRLLSRTYAGLGDVASCLDHAVCCVELLDDDTDPRERANCLIILGDALALARNMDEARRRYRAAEEILVDLGDLDRQILLYNNLAQSEYDAGEWDRAWAAAERMLALADEHDLRLPHPAYIDTIARAQMGLGRYDEAARTLQDWLAGRPPEQLESDISAEIVLTLAEVQRLQGDLRQAQATLDYCRSLADKHGLIGVPVRALAEQAELHAASGDFQRAYEVHKQFHTASEEAQSQEREAQAHIRQAMFETAEARQDAERFRDQARRDPLTGLHNRRFVDEHLPPLLARAVETGAPLTVAFVDLDHFKRINDTLSHEVGDQVLVAVAGLLVAAVDATQGAGFAARIGGEEFLLVLPDTAPAEAGRRLEELRLSVRAHPWRELADNLQVTVSIGSATAGSDCTQRGLLARADQNLYAAKNGGRDRVVLDVTE